MSLTEDVAVGVGVAVRVDKGVIVTLGIVVAAGNSVDVTLGVTVAVDVLVGVALKQGSTVISGKLVKAVPRISTQSLSAQPISPVASVPYIQPRYRWVAVNVSVVPMTPLNLARSFGHAFRLLALFRPVDTEIGPVVGETVDVGAAVRVGVGVAIAVSVDVAVAVASGNGTSVEVSQPADIATRISRRLIHLIRMWDIVLFSFEVKF